MLRSALRSSSTNWQWFAQGQRANPGIATRALSQMMHGKLSETSNIKVDAGIQNQQQFKPFKNSSAGGVKDGGVVGGKYKNRSISDIWQDLKEKHPGCLLMIQIGDFFEMLNEDAREASRILDIILTKRRIQRRYMSDEERQVDMAGIPVRSLQKHLPKLTRAGVKVIVVQQDQQAGDVKREWGKSMTRQVTRIVTPGTLYEEELLSPGENNYLAAMVSSNWSPDDQEKNSVGLAWADVSTGELWAQSVSVAGLREHLRRIDPKELLLPEDVDLHRPASLQWLFACANNGPQSLSSPTGPALTIVENNFFLAAEKKRKDKISSEGFSDREAMSSLETRAVNCLMRYVDSTLKPDLEWAKPRSANRKVLAMDSGTRQALEVVMSLRSSNSSKSGSLLNEVDYTVTAGGARLLRSRIESPLTDVGEISSRLDAVDYFYADPEATGQIRKLMRTLRDPARAFQRLRVGRWTLKDLVDVYSALEVARTVADEALPLAERSSTLVSEWAETMAGTNKSKSIQREGLEMVERTLLKHVKVFDEISHKRKELRSVAELHAELGRALYSAKHYVLLTPSGAIQRDDELEDVEEQEVVRTTSSSSKVPTEDDEDESHLRKRKRTAKHTLSKPVVVVDDDLDDEDVAPASATGMRTTTARLFKPGYSTAYDELYEETSGMSSKRVERLQRQYQQEHDPRIKIVGGGVGSGARVRNTLMGYVVEVPKSVQLNPLVFSPVQNLKHRTRYTTAELNLLSGDSLASRDALNETERAIADFLCGHCLALASGLEKVFAALSQMDVACSSAHAARERMLIRPKISQDEQQTLDVKASRHLVVERNNANFVSNDLRLVARGNPSAWLITGPNMGGKSTFLRSAASLVILAQAGLFVPATEARVGIVDRIFARIGASDDISNNRSTFMVEMEETAQFLSQATKDSLVIVDELGRGTSPQEGFAIAQAALEELVNIGARTLFATHFHRLATVPGGPCEQHPERVQTYTTEVIVVEDKGINEEKQVVFTYKMKPGAASSSFGINVARMAGVPEQVLARAEELLKRYE